MQPTTAPPPAANSQQALGNLQSFQGSMQSGPDILKGQEQSLGVPQAQQQVSGLRQAITNTTNLLNQVAPSVYGRTENSLVTTAQAGRQIANEQAPISQELSKQGTDLTNADTNFRDLLSQATTMADLQDKTQSEKLAGLQGIYQALYGQEKDSAAAAEAKRQFDVQQSLAQQQLARSSSGGVNLGALLGGGGNATPRAAANMSLKNPSNPGSGFAFTDNSGKAISAGNYAKTAGVPIGQVLYAMGQSGDVYAQQAYNQIKQNQSYYNAHPEVLKQEFNPLFWGT